MLLIIKNNSMFSSACFNHISIVIFHFCSMLCLDLLLVYFPINASCVCTYTLLTIFMLILTLFSSVFLCPFVYFCGMRSEWGRLSNFFGFVPSVNVYYHLINLCSQILKDAIIYINYINVNIFMISFVEYRCN
jgi:hypothetical protein